MSSLLKVNRVEPTNPAVPVDFGGPSPPTYNGVPLVVDSSGTGSIPTPAGAAQTNVVLTGGAGVPSNAAGVDGWIYFRSDGGTGTTIYHRRAGAWVAIV